jgi:hypothetical protein
MTETCTLDEVIAAAIHRVIEQEADTHIFKDDDAVKMSGYEHAIDEGQGCWCNPVVVYTDSVTGYKVYFHRTLEA